VISGLIMAIFNLIFTTDRSAILGIIIGFIWWFFFWEKWLFKSKRNLYVAIAIIILVIIISSLFLIIYFNGFISARPGSLETREIIYKKTIESWLEKPVFGWGVTRNIKDAFPEFEVRKNIPPLGTHSTYLGILYKQGAVGLLVFFWFLISIGISISRSYRFLKNKNDKIFFKLIGFASCGFIGNIVQGTFNMLDLDSLSFHISWINIALIVAAGYILKDTDNKIGF
jgi:putative inorganic carbon (hco3(-)) transporter